MSEVTEAATKLFQLVGQSPSHLHGFVHEGPPKSKARARIGKFGAFTPKKTVHAQRAIEGSFRRALCSEGPAKGNLALIVVFYRQNRRRIDADNMLKLVMDAGTKAGAWADDSQVTTQAALVHYDKARPRTVVAWCPIEGSLDRNDPLFKCRRCERTFKRHNPKSTPTFCSMKCRASDSKLATPVACPLCGTEFRRRNSYQKVCSQKCAKGLQSRAARPHGPPKCADAPASPSPATCAAGRAGRRPGTPAWTRGPCRAAP